MTGGIFEKLRKVLRGTVLADEPLAAHTTWRVGGPADLYLVPADAEDLVRALVLLQKEGVPWMAVGAGSNLLVRDGGVRRAVVDTGALRGLTFGEDGLVRAGAGLPLPLLVREAVRRGLEGIEALAGIPGSVGGAVAMNAGAGAQEIGGVLRSVVLAGPEGLQEWTAERLRFGYRHAALPEGQVVAEAVIQLRRGSEEELALRMQEALDWRRKTQRVTAPNAGSVFKNPPGRRAWELIEAAGLRGAREGGAEVAQEHANFIVNGGKATAKQIESLVLRVQRRVEEVSGVRLETEVRIVGEE